jgi:hypothetical protein
MSVDLLESADLSETRLSTYLAKTIRDISRAAGITVPGIAPIAYQDPAAVDSRPHTSTSYPPVGVELVQGTEGGEGPAAFDLENFLQIESQLDLGYLLGLPGDNSAAVQGAPGWSFSGGEFEFGLNGLGMDQQAMGMDGF